MRVDIIHADSSLKWVDVILRYAAFDLEFGDDNNDFELDMSVADATRSGREPIEDGDYVMVAGTEWGGVIDTHGFDNKDDVPMMAYKGRTWHGIMAASVIRPDSGQDYYTVSGDAVDVLRAIVSRQGLSKVFTVDGERGTTIKSYQFARYVDMYTGVKAMLASVGMRLEIVAGNGVCNVRPVKIVEWSSRIDDNFLRFSMEQNTRPVNHLICLGEGELKDRVVVDLYMDEKGNVSQKQTLFGVDEVAEVYDYSSAKSDELVEKGTEKLLDYWEKSKSVDVDSPEGVSPSIGDTVKGSSVVVPMQVEATVSKITAKIGYDGTPDVSYDVGSVKMM